ncbi:unnamed protein product [Triticum turgidum subsp. durum]|uniref:AAA+ ATPase domain-containing protein n=1 Tax=Triticum turgidum subsp. durum TaxID=4567 RepID=A0A9R0ZX73_TRITD|nr:unnamed protein product [Triticum turgidum subsp. durum]
MHRAMRMRCLLRPPPSCSAVPLATPATVGGGAGRFGAPDGSRRLGAPRLPFSERGRLCRFYSSKEGVGSAETAAGSGGGGSSSSNQQEHARLGEKDQQEWLSGERFVTGCKRRESPFLTKRERFRNEFLRRAVPWEKSSLTWSNFPYYVDKNAKQLLTECVASHLRNKDATLEYGSRLQSSGGRILLQSLRGTELYRERLVRAIAHELRVPLLVLDSSVLAPYDNGEDCSESEEENGQAESEDEGSESEGEDEDYNEAKSGESDDDESVKSMEALKKLAPRTLEELAKRVVSVQENSSAAEESTAESSEEGKRPLQKGDRVKYVGESVLVEADHRVILGKIPTQEGAAEAFTFISGRTLSNGQRGEIYEINGDQVAVLFDPPEEKLDDGKNDEANKAQDAKPSVCWVDIQDIVHDNDTEAEDWHIAMKAFCEALPSLQPAIVYFPDSSQWLSRAVPRSNRREFIEKVEEMFDQLNGPLVLICGQNILEAAPKDKDPKELVFHNLSRLSPLDDEQLREFNNQIAEDKKIIVSRHNLVELHKVLEDHGLSCENLSHVKLEGIILTKQRAEKVIGWARSHYLSSAISPSIKGDKLVIPCESLDLAIERLRELEASTKSLSENMKMLAKDEFERNFISAVVPPHEIGVKFEDIGALEDVKKTLDELVTLPMRRPELFSRGNLLRPCKGILLFGPPGTGKTLLAKALATEAGANFISITGSSLMSKWFGDAEKLTKALFSFASRLAPVIIFVDEVDSLLGARGGAMEHEATRRMRNEFMAAWDGLRSKESQRILILGATNRPFDLDDAVIRRLPRRIYVDLPDAQNRMKILKILLAKENLESEFGFDELANATEGYSGSDLKNLCVAAAYRPVHELLEEEKKVGAAGSAKTSLRSLKLDDFVQAKAKVSPSIAFDATSMNELRKWNEQYGEGGSRSKSPFGFGS